MCSLVLSISGSFYSCSVLVGPENATACKHEGNEMSGVKIVLQKKSQ